VIVPDYFEGDPLPIQMLRRDRTLSIDEQPWLEEDKQKLRDLDFPGWLQRHNHPRVSSLLIELLAELSKRPENTTIMGIGYCFGGKHILRLAKASLTAAAAFHPSFVEADDMADVQAPLYIGLAEKDDMVPASLPEDLQTWATTKMRPNVPFTVEIYPDVGHGFAARPDTKDDLIRAQYERGFQRTIEHFAKFVGGEN
jgi:dienelactone hydrolase